MKNNVQKRKFNSICIQYLQVHYFVKSKVCFVATMHLCFFLFVYHILQSVKVLIFDTCLVVIS